jgi:endonuclease G
MTRREDPIWGSEEEARLGNADSMHVTNAVPQLQSNNAGVWLRLENYALDNAREDDMRISVFTGPVLRIEDQSDEISEDVKYPEAFWKVIVFIHDKTKELCATGYLISQQESLKQRQLDICNGGVKNNEHVFGPHGSSQVPIVRIEQLTGLSFGQLSKLDPLASNLELPQIALTEPAQIQFLPR